MQKFTVFVQSIKGIWKRLTKLQKSRQGVFRVRNSRQEEIFISTKIVPHYCIEAYKVSSIHYSFFSVNKDLCILYFETCSFFYLKMNQNVFDSQALPVPGKGSWKPRFYCEIPSMSLCWIMLSFGFICVWSCHYIWRCDCCFPAFYASATVVTGGMYSVSVCASRTLLAEFLETYWAYFHQTFSICAFWDKDECFKFWDGSQGQSSRSLYVQHAGRCSLGPR